MKVKISQNKALKRKRILAAAKEIFFSSGFVGAGMDHIAAEAGVTKQTVYRYFANKEALFVAMLEEQRNQTANHFLEALNDEDPYVALQGFAEGFVRKHLSEEHLAMIRLLVAEGPQNPEITAAFFATGPKRTMDSLALFVQERFGISEAEDEIKAFLSILQSQRMMVLVGQMPCPTGSEIKVFAKKSVGQFLRLLKIDIC